MHFFSTRRPQFNPRNDTWDLGQILEDCVKLAHTVHLVQVFQQLIIEIPCFHQLDTFSILSFEHTVTSNQI